MPIDARINMSLQPTDIAGAIRTGMDWREGRQDNQRRTSLGELYTQDRAGAVEEAISAGDLELAKQFLTLDEAQQKQTSAQLDDVTAAVRWADTPDKWQQVQQYYGSQGHDVSAYPFESRESVVLQLGKMGEYLKSAPKAESQPSSVQEYEYAKRQGYTGTYMQFQDETGSPIVQKNDDNTLTVYPRSMMRGGGQSSAPPPPPPGFVIDGGPAAPQPGGFRPGPGF